VVTTATKLIKTCILQHARQNLELELLHLQEHLKQSVSFAADAASPVSSFKPQASSFAAVVTMAFYRSIVMIISGAINSESVMTMIQRP
jgi:hypothetical protein